MPGLPSRSVASPSIARWFRSLASIVGLRVAGFGFLLAVWWSASTQVQEVQLPSPLAAFHALRANFIHAPGLQLQGLEGGYLANTMYTVSNALAAFAIGTVLGVAVGMLSARLQAVRDLSAPPLLLFATVPELVAAPFFLIWFGPSRVGQGTIVAFYSYVVVAIASQNGALRLSPRYEEFAATLGATRWRRFLTVVMPGALPTTVGAVRVALATSWSLQTAGELLGSQRGVGRVIVLSQQLGFTPGTLAVITLMGFVALLADLFVASGLRWLGRWQETISR